MAVRRQCNRYKTAPFGKDFNDVVKRGKSFYKDGAFMVWGGSSGGCWEADRLPAECFKIPQDARIFLKGEHRWVDVTDVTER